MQTAVYGKTSYDYLIYLPKNYDKSKKYPLILFLHGSGERGDNLELLKLYGIPKILESKDINAIVVSPQCKRGAVFTSQTHKLKELLEHVQKEYLIDENAISITGLSMGGHGTLQMAADYPEIFSCVAPICAGGMSWRAEVIKDLPIRLYHGEADDVVDVFYSKDYYKKLIKAGAKNAELILYPNVNHNSWDKAYGETDLIDWLIKNRKQV